MQRVMTGLDRFREEFWKGLKRSRLGLLSNQASLDARLIPAKEVVSRCLPGRLKALFGPQHGMEGADQDNMIETAHGYDKGLDVPVFSLYSEKREPLPEMLENIDLIIVDLQDVGTRVYTFASTMLGCLRAAEQCGKEVLILDRPNPVGGEIVEGNLLKPEFYSFVGPFSLPMRHGLTMGEMAKIFVEGFEIDLDLQIIPMRGWARNMIWQDTGLRWLMPSPNMPIPETAQVYPGQVIWEGTNLSEGRGTCRPFEIFGAPFLDTDRLQRALPPQATRGCVLQDIGFRPTFNKWANDFCRGFMIHILDPACYRPYLTSLSLLRAVMEIHPHEFEWKPPPYEYEFERMPIDLILGDQGLRLDLEHGPDPFEIGSKWDGELKDYLEWRKPYLLYT